MRHGDDEIAEALLKEFNDAVAASKNQTKLKPKQEQKPGIEEIQLFYYIVHPDRYKMLAVFEKVKKSWEAFAKLNLVKLKFTEVEEFPRLQGNECLLRFSTMKAAPKELKVYDLMPRQKDLCFGSRESVQKYELDQVDLAGKFLILDIQLNSQK